jgi:hypothetical protein
MCCCFPSAIGAGRALTLIASGNETAFIIEHYVAGDGRIRERRVSLVYDRSGTVERVIQGGDVDLAKY